LNQQTICREKWNQAKVWFQSDLGRSVYESELKVIKNQLESCFGYNIVQLGTVCQESLIKDARIKRKFVLECGPTALNGTSAQSYFQQLAIKNNSIDAIVLHHTLEFEEDPHAILREVERVLVPEGKLIVVLFNPFSLWGMWHVYLHIKQLVRHQKPILPSPGRLISQKRLKDWLSLLGFNYSKSEPALFRPPVNKTPILRHLKFMEKAGARYWPGLAGSYSILATKRISTLTPIRPKWSLRKKVMGSRVPETSANLVTTRKKFKDKNDR